MISGLNIPSAAPVDVTTPTTGQYALFLDATNGNKLSYIDSNRQLFTLDIDMDDVDNDEKEGSECPCDIEKMYWEGVMCAFKQGFITAAELQAIVSLGFNVQEAVVTDNAGNTSTTIVTGRTAIPLVDFTITSSTTPTIAALATSQITTTFTPANATNKGLIYVSNNPSKATVSSTGLITGVATGSATIYVYSVENLAIVHTVAVTVS